jgi:predicted DNA-binding transcriptional regulator YafY
MSKIARLEKYLNEGNQVTAKEISARFRLASGHTAIRDLRRLGVMIYGNKSQMSDGTTTTRYRVGRPSRSFIAEAFNSGIRI